MLNPISKNGLILSSFALVTTALIVLTFLLTKDTIEEAKRQQLLAVLNEVVPESAHNNRLYQDCIILEADARLGGISQHAYRARQDQNNVAIIIETTAPDGYSGDIELIVAVDTKQTVLGARVLAHKETPGLGDKIDLRVSDWILDFSNVAYHSDNRQRWQVKKDGGQFDQFTGATITPRAVVRAIANAAEYVIENQSQLFALPSNCGVSNTNDEVTDERI